MKDSPITRRPNLRTRAKKLPIRLHLEFWASLIENLLRLKVFRPPNMTTKKRLQSPRRSSSRTMSFRKTSRLSLMISNSEDLRSNLTNHPQSSMNTEPATDLISWSKISRPRRFARSSVTESKACRMTGLLRRRLPKRIRVPARCKWFGRMKTSSSRLSPSHERLQSTTPTQSLTTCESRGRINVRLKPRHWICSRSTLPCTKT